ncbi:unnamed protein product [Symbiodinium natans]|uniref:Uncharacterized protein n=1 Tax=Symbiodinium natans TaxID=878477 RepID=A0A812S608_9DINO|nr:unnamed protein product [Symbiodinium natans]
MFSAGVASPLDAAASSTLLLSAVERLIIAPRARGSPSIETAALQSYVAAIEIGRCLCLWQRLENKHRSELVVCVCACAGPVVGLTCCDLEARSTCAADQLWQETPGDFNTECWASWTTSLTPHDMVLLTRYRALFGPHDEGAGWHMALTEEAANG